MGIRVSCCGKKRKNTQIKWVEGYDHGSWICKKGYGCKKLNTDEHKQKNVEKF